MNDAPPKLKKSDRSRAAILAAARALFVAQGYERTSVRDIAAAAAIDPAMVIRYFGSKEALFARAAEFDLGLPDLSDVPSDGVGEVLVRHFLQVWEGPEESSGFVVLLRSALSHAAAGDRMREVFATQLLPELARAAGGRLAPDRAGLVASQMLGLALTRYVLKLPPVVTMSPEAVVRLVGPTIQRYLMTD